MVTFKSCAKSFRNVRPMAWSTLNWQITTTLVLQLWCKEGQLTRLGLTCHSTVSVGPSLVGNLNHCAAARKIWRLDIAPKENTKMMWRPNSLQLTHLRSTNAASFFSEGDLSSNGALRKATC